MGRCRGWEGRNEAGGEAARGYALQDQVLPAESDLTSKTMAMRGAEYDIPRDPLV